MAKPKAPGEYMAHAERAKRTGRVRVDVYVSAEAADALERMAIWLEGNKTDAVEAALLFYAAKNLCKRPPKKSSA